MSRNRSSTKMMTRTNRLRCTWFFKKTAYERRRALMKMFVSKGLVADFYNIWSTHDNNMVDNMMAMLWQYNDNTDDNSDNGWSELVGRVTQQRGRQYPPNAFTSDAQSARTFVRTTTFINPLFSKSSAQNIFTPDKVGPTHIKYSHHICLRF